MLVIYVKEYIDDFFLKVVLKVNINNIVVYYWMVIKLICKYEIIWWYFVGVMLLNLFGFRF